MRTTLGKWEQGQLSVRTIGGVAAVDGAPVYRGIGLYATKAWSDDGISPEVLWSVTHASSGYRICAIHAQAARALKLAEELAETVDFTRDLSAILQDKDAIKAAVRAFAERHDEVGVSGSIAGIVE